MAGIYLHYPFCRSKCNYCNFFSLATNRFRDEFHKALLDEIRLRADYLGRERISTIYFGGGTPSLYRIEELSEVIELLSATFTLEEPEITLEANPGDLDPSYLRALFNAGINRLSIGIQSFHDDDLIYLNREHSAVDGIKSINEASDAGFNNITIDLIYGVPGLTDEKWHSNLEMVSSLPVSHLSAYWLTIEENTILQRLIRKGKMAPLSDEEGTRHYYILREWSAGNGFEHYEISNLCRDHQYSRHNLGYWSGDPYLGLGPSAHSFNGFSRQWNAGNLSLYIGSVSQGKIPFTLEVLTDTDKYNEYVLTGLRTCWGIDVEHIRAKFGENIQEWYLAQARPYLEDGTLLRDGKSIRFSGDGWLHSDSVTAALFVPENGLLPG